MSVNKYRDHLSLLPEDDATRQLANGFVNNIDTGQVQILPEARGWAHVCDDFAEVHVAAMRRYPKRIMVLIVDFDNDPERLSRVRAKIPSDLRERVFVLGVLSEPETLREAAQRSYEDIGRAMAEDCRTRTQTMWAHELLKHNAPELSGLRNLVRAWLFEP